VHKLLPHLNADVEVTGRNQDVYTVKVNGTAGGRGLTRPVQFNIPVPRNKADARMYAYVIDSMSKRLVYLTPFVFQNDSLLKLGSYLLNDASASAGTLYEYIYTIDRFCRWIQKTPDQLMMECMGPDGLPDVKTVQRHSQLLYDWYLELKADGLAGQTLAHYLKGPKALYASNGLQLPWSHRINRRVVCKDRAPRPEELQLLLDIADLRDRVIISCLALGGFRESTLARLCYRHVREDLENGTSSIHVHVEAEITKGKYNDYDTFLGDEATHFIREYLKLRRQGTRYTPPEEIHDESPLIRNKNCKKPKGVTAPGLYVAIHKLYRKTNMLGTKRGRRYMLRPHSIRKFFRTQMGALGVPPDYIEYMMGHTISTYNDIQMKGTEFLRNIYAASGLSIRPKTALSKVDALKEIIRAWGMNPEEILTREALSIRHHRYATPYDREENHIKTLRRSLKEMMRKELLDKKQA